MAEKKLKVEHATIAIRGTRRRFQAWALAAKVANDESWATYRRVDQTLHLKTIDPAYALIGEATIPTESTDTPDELNFVINVEDVFGALAAFGRNEQVRMELQPTKKRAVLRGDAYTIRFNPFLDESVTRKITSPLIPRQEYTGIDAHKLARFIRAAERFSDHISIRATKTRLRFEADGAKGGIEWVVQVAGGAPALSHFSIDYMKLCTQAIRANRCGEVSIFLGDDFPITIEARPDEDKPPVVGFMLAPRIK